MNWKLYYHKCRITLGLIIFTFTLFSSCQRESNYLDATYKGAWYDTWFDYTFKPNGTFIYNTRGHYGYTTTKGKYAIIDSVILLRPYTEGHLSKGGLIMTHKNTCLYDSKKHYYCIDEEDSYTFEEEHRNKLEIITNRLLQLEDVKKTLSEYPTPQTYEEREYYPKFEFEETIWLDKRLYYRIKLKERNRASDYEYSFVGDHQYLVDCERNKIYKQDILEGFIFVAKF